MRMAQLAPVSMRSELKSHSGMHVLVMCGFGMLCLVHRYKVAVDLHSCFLMVRYDLAV